MRDSEYQLNLKCYRANNLADDLYFRKIENNVINVFTHLRFKFQLKIAFIKAYDEVSPLGPSKNNPNHKFSINSSLLIFDSSFWRE